jgi:hypothetical protein
MTRCLQCNGILAKNERVCYSCGEAAPIQSRSAGNGYSLLLALAFIVSLGLTAFSFLSGR